MNDKKLRKPLIWMGSTRREIRGFPEEVKDTLGYALLRAQEGGKHADAKPLKGFGGAGVLEAISHHAGDTYRAVYTVKFAEAVYALHVFQKKSKRGIKTPKADIDLIKDRLTAAEQDYEERFK